MSSQGAQVLFTVITSRSPLTKSYHLEDNGQIASSGKTILYDGEAETKSISSLAEFNTFLNTLTPHQAITLGIFDPRPGAKTQIVTQEYYDSQTDRDGLATRSKQFFRYHPGPGLILYDIDDHWIQEFAPDLLCADIPSLVINELNLPYALVRPSSSSRVKPNARSFHVYTIVENAIHTEEMLKTDFARLVLKHHGFAVLTHATNRKPATLIRSLIDDNVGGPERLVYEAPPIAAPPLVVKPLQSYVVGQHHFRKHTPLSPVESYEYTEYVKHLRSAIEPLRIKRSDSILVNYLDHRVNLLAGSSPTPELIHKIRQEATTDFTAADRGFAVGQLEIHTDKLGPVTVTDILKTDIYARLKGFAPTYHNQTCADPFEPSYGTSPGRIGRGRAKIYTGENPCIHSFAHGSTTIALRIRAKDLTALLQRGQEESVDLHTLLYELWRITHFEDTERVRVRAEVIDFFPDKKTRAIARDMVKLAEKNELPIVSETTIHHPELANLKNPESDGVADLLTDTGNFIYSFRTKAFTKWTEEGWKRGVTTQVVEEEVKQTLELVADLYPKKATNIRSAKYLQDTMFHMRSTAKKGDDIRFDSDPMLLQAPNCTIDLREHKIREKRRSEYLTMTMGCDPVPGPTPTYNQFMSNIAGDNIEFYTDLEYCLAIALASRLGKHLIHFVGPTNSGKSVVMWLLTTLFSEYTGIPTTEFFVQKNNPPAEERLIAPVMGKRLAVCNELPELPINVSLLKRITGEDRVATRVLYQESEGYVCKNLSVVMAGNSRPKLLTADNAFANRLVLIEFDRVFVEPNGRAPDPLLNEFPAIMDIRARLQAELPHIFHRLLSIAFDCAEESFHVPVPFKQTMADLDTHDPLMRWAREAVHIIPQNGSYISNFCTYAEIRNHLDAYLSLKGEKRRIGDHQLQDFLRDMGALPVAHGDTIITPDGTTHCAGPQGVLWLNGIATRLRKNIRLNNVFAAPG